MSIPSGIYQHFKGSYYKVLDIARHSESEEEYVIYRPLKGDSGTWIRPLHMFQESVERDGVIQPRFKYLGPDTQSIEET